MISSDLAASGFGPWWSFSRIGERQLLAQVPRSPGVYAIRRRFAYPRSVGESDILYIGCATNTEGLNRRLRQYFHPGPTQRTNHRIMELVGISADFEISVVICDSVGSSRALAATLLEQYERDHGQLPPENRKR